MKSTRLHLSFGLPFRLFLVLTVLAAQPSRADVRPPIKISVPRDSVTAPPAGQEFAGVFEVTVGEHGALQRVTLSGDGWVVEDFRPDLPINLVAGEIVSFAYRAIPTDPAKPLVASVVFNGQGAQRAITVSPQRFGERGKARPSSRMPGSTGLRPGADPSPPAPSSLAGGSVTLRFAGCIQYTRMDGRVMAADGVRFDIMDDDSPDFDEAIYSGYTGIDGCFDITTNWDDCDVFGCDDPDIYLYYETDTLVVTVQDSDILEEDYNWDTDSNIYNDYTGNFIDFGVQFPSNMGDHPALHIHSNITRAHRFMLTRDGTSVPHVDAQWPESDNGAFYNPFFNEIHIGPNEQWTEGTIIHEWGHHFLELESVNLTPDYCNPFCDAGACADDSCNPFDPGDTGGHCNWCPETNHDAWNEGFPNWLGSVVIRSFATDYPLDYPAMPAPSVRPLSINDDRYMLNTPQNCCQDMQNYVSQADITEGFAGALLRDVEDGDLDNHVMDVLPDCSMDAMGLGPEEILQVVRLDLPTNPLDFINKFRARFPQYDHDFWSTCGNVSSVYLSQFPVPTPEIVSQTQGCQGGIAGQPLTLNVQGNGSLLKYQWRRNQTELTDGGRISNATKSSLTINPLTAADAGTYDCIVTSCDGSIAALSGPISVVVYAPRSAGLPGLSWGRNDMAQMGQGAAANHFWELPSSVAGINDFSMIVPGSLHTLGLRADGTVWAWGQNQYHQLGTTQPGFFYTPIQVQGLTNIIGVAGSYTASFALGADSKVYSWGEGFYGELGDGSMGNNTRRAAPAVVPGLDCVAEICASPFSVMAIKSDGTVWTWGSNNVGQLGLGSSSGVYPVPQQVPGITDAVSGACADIAKFVVRANGTALSWGYNGSGELGDGTTTTRPSPVAVVGVSNIRSIASVSRHVIAVLNDGTALGWGANYWGELGNGMTNQVAVTTPGQVVGMNNVVEAAVTGATSVFRRMDGTIWVCGTNFDVGLGTDEQQGSLNLQVSIPRQLMGIAGAEYVAAGGGGTFVLAPAMAVNITQQPMSRTHVEGQSASFMVTATGTPALTYQWMRNNVPVTDGGAISGATTASLTINPAATNNAGNYTVAVTNIQGTVSSQPAVLTVTELPFDINADDLVNAVDLAAFVVCQGAPGVPPVPGPGPTPQACQAVFDLGNDLDVDLEDFAEFQNAFAP